MCEYKVDTYLVRILNIKLMNTCCLKRLSEWNHRFNSFMSEFQCLKGSGSLLMDMVFPLLGESSVRRLRRCAATLIVRA